MGGKSPFICSFIKMGNEQLSEWPIVQNWGFILFLFCFFISIQFLRKEKLLFSMQESLFRAKERQNVFTVLVNNELSIKLLMCLQTIILFSVVIYHIFSNTTDLQIDSAEQLFAYFGVVSLALLLFFLCKFLFNILIGNIFFPKEKIQLWNDNFLSIISLSGLVLFIPTLLMFYIKETYLFCYYFYIIYSILVVFLMIYKIYVIFFQDKSLLLYFILYLCAHEIVPLYFLYRVLGYLFITMQKGTLWLQM